MICVASQHNEDSDWGAEGPGRNTADLTDSSETFSLNVEAIVSSGVDNIINPTSSNY